MTTTIEIKVPDVGDFSDIPVIEVLVSVGDHVKAEDSLITLESDKATMEIPAPQAGVIREMRLKLNDKVSEGDVVAILEVTGETVAGDNAPGSAGAETQSEPPRAAPESDSESEGDSANGAEPVQNQPVAEPQPVHDSPATQTSSPQSSTIARGPAAVDPSVVPYASPSVRQFARELGADLMQVKGSGTNSRILRKDVAGFIKSVMTRPPQEPAISSGFVLPPPPKVDFSKFGAITLAPLSRIQKLSAGHLHRNWVSIPHVTQHDEADITDMENFRKAHVADAEKQGFKLTPLVFLIKASVAALKNFPQFNASLDVTGENLILKSYYNIGIAVDTPEGLVVPVLRECDRKIGRAHV